MDANPQANPNFSSYSQQQYSPPASGSQGGFQSEQSAHRSTGTGSGSSSSNGSYGYGHSAPGNQDAENYSTGNYGAGNYDSDNYYQGKLPYQHQNPWVNKFFTALRASGWRRSEQRWLGGVCGAVANRTGIDVALVRGLIVFISLFFAWWLLPMLYVIAWLVLPDEHDEIALDTLLQGQFNSVHLGILTLLVVAILLSGGSTFMFGVFGGGFGIGLFLLGLIVSIGTLVFFGSTRRSPDIAQGVSSTQGAAQQGFSGFNPGYPQQFATPSAGANGNSEQGATFFADAAGNTSAAATCSTEAGVTSSHNADFAASAGAANSGRVTDSSATRAGSAPGAEAGSADNPAPYSFGATSAATPPDTPPNAPTPPTPPVNFYQPAPIPASLQTKRVLSPTVGMIVLGLLVLGFAALSGFRLSTGEALFDAHSLLCYAGFSALVVGLVLAFAAIRGQRGGWLTVFSAVIAVIGLPVLLVAALSLAVDASREGSAEDSVSFSIDNEITARYESITLSWDVDSLYAYGSAVMLDLTDIPEGIDQNITVSAYASTIDVLVTEEQAYALEFYIPSIDVTWECAADSSGEVSEICQAVVQSLSSQLPETLSTAGTDGTGYLYSPTYDSTAGSQVSLLFDGSSSVVTLTIVSADDNAQGEGSSGDDAQSGS